MSDANRVGLLYAEETTWGTVPSPAATFKRVRFTSEDFKQATDTDESEEIVSDRQVADIIRQAIRAEGPLNFEFSYGAFDDFIQAALMAASGFGSETVICASDTAVDASSADNSFNHATAWDATPTVGEWIRVTGFTETANNGYFKVLTATSQKITVSGGTLVTEAAGDSIDIDQAASLVNGTTPNSYTIEREYEDVANEFAYFTGMMVDQFNLNVPSRGKVNGSFQFIGKQEVSATATQGDGSPTAAPTNSIMQTVDHVSAILENYGAVTVVEANISLSNNLRDRAAVGVLGALSIGSGRCRVSGNVQLYFSSKTIPDKYLNFTESSLCIVLAGSGGQYVFELPATHYTDMTRGASGVDQDVIVNVALGAKKDASEAKTIRVSRWAA